MVYSCLAPCNYPCVLEPATVSQPAERAGGTPATVLVKMMSRGQIPCGFPTTVNVKQHFIETPARLPAESPASTGYSASKGTPLDVRQEDDRTASVAQCLAAEIRATSAGATTLAVGASSLRASPTGRTWQVEQARLHETHYLLSRRCSRPIDADADIVCVANPPVVFRSEYEGWTRKRTAALPEQLPANIKRTRVRRAFGTGGKPLAPPPRLVSVQAENVTCKQRQCMLRPQQCILQEHKQQHSSTFSSFQQQQTDKGCSGLSSKPQQSLITGQQQIRYPLRNQKQRCGFLSGRQGKQWKQGWSGKGPRSRTVKQHQFPQWRAKVQQQGRRGQNQKEQMYHWLEIKKLTSINETRHVRIPQPYSQELFLQRSPGQRKLPPPYRRLLHHELQQWQPVALPRLLKRKVSVKHSQHSRSGESLLSVATIYRSAVASGVGSEKTGVAARVIRHASTETEAAAPEKNAATLSLTEASAHAMPVASGTTRSKPAAPATRQGLRVQSCNKSILPVGVRSPRAPSLSCPSKEVSASAAVFTEQDRLVEHQMPLQKQQHSSFQPARYHQGGGRQRVEPEMLHVFRIKEHVAVEPAERHSPTNVFFPLRNLIKRYTKPSSISVTERRCLPVWRGPIQLPGSEGVALQNATILTENRAARTKIAVDLQEAPAACKHDGCKEFLNTLGSANAGTPRNLCHSAAEKNAMGAVFVNSFSRAAGAALVDAGSGKSSTEGTRRGQTQRQRSILVLWRLKREPEGSRRAGITGVAGTGLDSPAAEREGKTLGIVAPALVQVTAEEGESAGSAGAEMRKPEQYARTATTPKTRATMAAAVAKRPCAGATAFGRGTEALVTTAKSRKGIVTTADPERGGSEEGFSGRELSEAEKGTAEGELDEILEPPESTCSDQDFFLDLHQESNATIISNSYFDAEVTDYLTRGDTQSSVSSAEKAKGINRCSNGSGSLWFYSAKAKGVWKSAVGGWRSGNASCINSRSSSTLSSTTGRPATSSAFCAAATLMNSSEAIPAESRRSSVTCTKSDLENHTAALDAGVFAVGASQAVAAGDESKVDEDECSAEHQSQVVNNSIEESAEAKKIETRSNCLGEEGVVNTLLTAHMEACDYTASSAATGGACLDCTIHNAVAISGLVSLAPGRMENFAALKSSLQAKKVAEGGRTTIAEDRVKLLAQDAVGLTVSIGSFEAPPSPQEEINHHMRVYPEGGRRSKRSTDDAGLAKEDGRNATTESAAECGEMEGSVLDITDKALVVRLPRRDACQHSSAANTIAVQQVETTKVASTAGGAAPSATLLAPAKLVGCMIAPAIASSFMATGADETASRTGILMDTAAVYLPSSSAVTGWEKATPASLRRRDNEQCKTASVNDTDALAWNTGSVADIVPDEKASNEATHIKEPSRYEPTHSEPAHSQHLQQRQSLQVDVSVASAPVQPIVAQRGQEQKNLQQLQASLEVTLPRQPRAHANQSAAALNLLLQQLRALLQFQNEKAGIPVYYGEKSRSTSVPIEETEAASVTRPDMLQTACAPAASSESKHRHHGDTQQVQQQPPGRQLQKEVLYDEQVRPQPPEELSQKDQQRRTQKPQYLLQKPCLKEPSKLLQESQQQPTPNQQLIHRQVQELHKWGDPARPRNSCPDSDVPPLCAASLCTAVPWYGHSTYSASLGYSSLADTSGQGEDKDKTPQLEVAYKQHQGCVERIRQLLPLLEEEEGERQQGQRLPPKLWNRSQVQQAQDKWRIPQEWQQQRQRVLQQRGRVWTCGEYRKEALLIDSLERQCYRAVQYNEELEHEDLSWKHRQQQQSNPPGMRQPVAQELRVEHINQRQTQQRQPSLVTENCLNNPRSNVRQINLKAASLRWLRCALQYVWRLHCRVQVQQQQQGEHQQAAQPQDHLPEWHHELHVVVSRSTYHLCGNEPCLLTSSSERDAANGVMQEFADVMDEQSCVAIPDTTHEDFYLRCKPVLAPDDCASVSKEPSYATISAADQFNLQYAADDANKSIKAAGVTAQLCLQELPVARQQLLAAAAAVLPRLYSETSAAAPSLRPMEQFSTEDFLTCKAWRMREYEEHNLMRQRNIFAFRSHDGSTLTNGWSRGSTQRARNSIDLRSRIQTKMANMRSSVCEDGSDLEETGSNTSGNIFNKAVLTISGSTCCSNTSRKPCNNNNTANTSNLSLTESEMIAADYTNESGSYSRERAPSALEAFLMPALPLLTNTAETPVANIGKADHVEALPAEHNDNSATGFVGDFKESPQHSNANDQRRRNAKCSASSTGSNNITSKTGRCSSIVSENPKSTQSLRNGETKKVQETAEALEYPTLLTGTRVHPHLEWLQQLLLRGGPCWMNTLQQRHGYTNRALQPLENTMVARTGLHVELCREDEKPTEKPMRLRDADEYIHRNRKYFRAACHATSSPYAATSAEVFMPAFLSGREGTGGAAAVRNLCPCIDSRAAAACAAGGRNVRRNYSLHNAARDCFPLDAAAAASCASSKSDDYSKGAPLDFIRCDPMNALLRRDGCRPHSVTEDQELLLTRVLSLVAWVRRTIKRLFVLNASHQDFLRANTCSNHDCYCNPGYRRRVQERRKTSHPRAEYPTERPREMKKQAATIADADAQAPQAAFKLTYIAGEEAAAAREPDVVAKRFSQVRRAAAGAVELAPVAAKTTGTSFSISAASAAESAVEAATMANYFTELTTAQNIVQRSDAEILAAILALSSAIRQSHHQAEDQENVKQLDRANRSHSESSIEIAVAPNYAGVEEGKTETGKSLIAIHEGDYTVSARGPGCAGKLRAALGAELKEGAEEMETGISVDVAEERKREMFSGLQDVYLLFRLVPELYRDNATAFSLLVHDSALSALFPLHPEEVAAFAGLMLQQPQPVAALLHRWLAPQYCSCCKCCTCCCNCCCCCSRETSPHSQTLAADTCSSFCKRQVYSEQHQQMQVAPIPPQYVSQEIHAAQRAISSQQRTGEQEWQVNLRRIQQPRRAYTEDLLVCGRSMSPRQQCYSRQCRRSLADAPVDGGPAGISTRSTLPQPTLAPPLAARTPIGTSAATTASKNEALFDELSAARLPRGMTAGADQCSNFVLRRAAELMQNPVVSKRKSCCEQPPDHHPGGASWPQQARCTQRQLLHSPPPSKNIKDFDDFSQEKNQLQKDTTRGRHLDSVISIQLCRARGGEPRMSGGPCRYPLSLVHEKFRRFEHAESSTLYSASRPKPARGEEDSQQALPVREVEAQSWASLRALRPPQEREQHQAAARCRKEEQQPPRQAEPMLQIVDGVRVQMLREGLSGHPTPLRHLQSDRQQHPLGQQQSLRRLTKKQENEPKRPHVSASNFLPGTSPALPAASNAPIPPTATPLSTFQRCSAEEEVAVAPQTRYMSFSPASRCLDPARHAASALLAAGKEENSALTPACSKKAACSGKAARAAKVSTLSCSYKILSAAATADAVAPVVASCTTKEPQPNPLLIPSQDSPLDATFRDCSAAIVPTRDAAAEEPGTDATSTYHPIRERRRTEHQCDTLLPPRNGEARGALPSFFKKESNTDGSPKLLARTFHRSIEEARPRLCVSYGTTKLLNQECFLCRPAEPSYKPAFCYPPLPEAFSPLVSSASSSSATSSNFLSPDKQQGICTASHSPFHCGTSGRQRSCRSCNGSSHVVCHGCYDSGGRCKSNFRDNTTSKGSTARGGSCTTVQCSSIGDGEASRRCQDDSPNQTLHGSDGSDCAICTGGLTKEQVSTLCTAYPPEKAADSFTQQLCDMFTGTIGAPAITVYVRRLQELSRLGAHEALMALLLLSRLMSRHPYMPFCPWNAHRLILAAFLIITKTVSDRFYNNRVWARFGGIKVTELNRLEKAFLILIDHRCFISLEQFAAGYALLKRTRCMFPASLDEQKPYLAATSLLLHRCDTPQQMHAAEPRPKESLTQYRSGERTHRHEELHRLQQSQQTQLSRLQLQHVHPEPFDPGQQQQIRRMQREQPSCTAEVPLPPHGSRSRRDPAINLGPFCEAYVTTTNGKVYIDGRRSTDCVRAFRQPPTACACAAIIRDESAAKRGLNQLAIKQAAPRRAAVEDILSANDNESQLKEWISERSAVKRSAVKSIQQSGGRSGRAGGFGAEGTARRVVGGEPGGEVGKVRVACGENNKTYLRRCGAPVTTMTPTPSTCDGFPASKSATPRGMYSSHTGAPHSKRGNAVCTNGEPNVSGKGSSCLENRCSGSGGTRLLGPCYSSARSRDRRCCRCNESTPAWSGLANDEEPEVAEKNAATPKAYRQLLVLRSVPFIDLQQCKWLGRHRSKCTRLLAHENLGCFNGRLAETQLPSGGSAGLVAAEKGRTGYASSKTSGKHHRRGTNTGEGDSRFSLLTYLSESPGKTATQNAILHSEEIKATRFRNDVSTVQQDDRASLRSVRLPAVEGSVFTRGSDAVDEISVDALTDERTVILKTKQSACGGSRPVPTGFRSPQNKSWFELIENPFANLVFCPYPPLQRVLKHLNDMD